MATAAQVGQIICTVAYTVIGVLRAGHLHMSEGCKGRENQRLDRNALFMRHVHLHGDRTPSCEVKQTGFIRRPDIAHDRKTMNDR